MKNFIYMFSVLVLAMLISATSADAAYTNNSGQNQTVWAVIEPPTQSNSVAYLLFKGSPTGEAINTVRVYYASNQNSVWKTSNFTMGTASCFMSGEYCSGVIDTRFISFQLKAGNTIDSLELQNILKNTLHTITSFTTTDPRDFTPPAEVTTLTASDITHNSFTLNLRTPTTVDFDRYKIFLNNTLNYTSPPGTAKNTNFTRLFAGLQEATTYKIKVTTVDTLGNESSGRSIEVTTINPAPETPTGLRAYPGNGKVQLQWYPNVEDDLAGYNLYRDGLKVNTQTITNTEYINTGLTNFVTYSYQVSAIDTENFESPLSAAVTAMPEDPDLTPPSPPTGIAGIPGDGSAELTWNANTEHDTAGYNLYQDGVKINNTLIVGTSFMVNGLSNDTTYTFAIRAVDTAGNESGLSASVSVTPINSIIPKNVRAQSGTNRMIVSWNPVTDATEYYLYRDGVIIATITNDTYIDVNVSNGSTYTYYVIALVDGILSDPSLSTTATVGQVVEFPTNSGGLPAILDVIKSAFSFAGMFAPYLILLLSLMLVGSIIGFFYWLFTPPKIKPMSAARERRELSPEEKERQKRERKLWKARYDKYDLLTRQGKINERDKWIRESNVEGMEKRIATRNKRRERMNQNEIRRGREPTNSARVQTAAAGREQREARAGRSDRNGRK